MRPPRPGKVVGRRRLRCRSQRQAPTVPTAAPYLTSTTKATYFTNVHPAADPSRAEQKRKRTASGAAHPDGHPTQRAPPSPVKSTRYTFVLVEDTKTAHSTGYESPNENKCVSFPVPDWPPLTFATGCVCFTLLGTFKPSLSTPPQQLPMSSSLSEALSARCPQSLKARRPCTASFCSQRYPEVKARTVGG